MADPDRGFDAIVIGEHERASYGGQYAAMAPLFEHYGIQLWTPESSGPIDFLAGQHEQMMLALGWQSKREITRTRDAGPHRMAAKTREQGRYLGGPATVRGIGWRMRAAPEQGTRRLGETRPPAGTRPAYHAGRAVNVRSAAGQAQPGQDHPGL
jgi:hypothetical protein